MIFNESIKRRIELSSDKLSTYRDIFLGRSWKAAVYSLNGELLGISFPFNFKPKRDDFVIDSSINFLMQKTGKASYMILIENQIAIGELIKSYAILIEEMKRQRKRKNEILKSISEHEAKGYEITMEIGDHKKPKKAIVMLKEFNLWDTHLFKDANLTIDMLNIQIGD
jgi:hypothetical protein